jgi:hypothetical protein
VSLSLSVSTDPLFIKDGPLGHVDVRKQISRMGKLANPLKESAYE